MIFKVLMYINGIAEYPARVDLRDIQAKYPLPQPGAVDRASMISGRPNEVARATLAALNSGLAARDVTAVGKCFFPGQAFWRDTLALTSHIRTFAGETSVVARSLLETTKLKGLTADFELSGSAQFIPATPGLVSSQPSVSGNTSPKMLTDKALTEIAIY